MTTINHVGLIFFFLSYCDNNKTGFENSEHIYVCLEIIQIDRGDLNCSNASDNNQSGDCNSQTNPICSSATDNNQSGVEDSESDMSDIGWDEEAYSALIQAVLVPAPALPGAPPGTPPDLTVDTLGQAWVSSCLPLAIVTNAPRLPCYSLPSRSRQQHRIIQWH